MQTHLVLTFTMEEFNTILETSINNAINKAFKELNQKSMDERLTRKQLCELYKISMPTLHTHMKKGLYYEKVGRKTLFKRVETDKYFKALSN